MNQKCSASSNCYFIFLMIKMNLLNNLKYNNSNNYSNSIGIISIVINNNFFLYDSK